MSRLVVISNRVAIPDEQGHPTPGGLAVAVHASLQGRAGLWFGWSGRVAEAPAAPATLDDGQLCYVLTDVRPQDFQEYYNGFANRVLWPILHYRVDLSEFKESDLKGYLRVNEFFAERLSPLIAEDDILWVHDYHLIPLALALRARGHGNRIGFFLHIPLPPPEILSTLPHHREVLGALCEYNLIGLQTASDVSNLGRYLTQVLGANSSDGEYYHLGSQHFRLGAFPVGIDAEGFRDLAEQAADGVLAEALSASLAGRALLVGVDRLDYSKGICNRLEGYERCLELHPEWHGRVSYLQIAPSSRSDIPEYIEIDAAVSAKVGHINGRFGTASWVPLRYVNRNHSREDVATIMRLARIGLVTPLRDGMNLVAKEYVAAQDPADPGVLILSQFAGAAAELEAALIVNPYDRDALAEALVRALQMPLAERRARHQALYEVILANPIGSWGSRFIEALLPADFGLA